MRRLPATLFEFAVGTVHEGKTDLGLNVTSPTLVEMKPGHIFPGRRSQILIAFAILASKL